jgi:hypothetical protein
VDLVHPLPLLGEEQLVGDLVVGSRPGRVLGFNLTRAKGKGAILARVKLSRADLSGADLSVRIYRVRT